MAKANVYAIFDSKAAAYLRPMFLPNNAMVLRVMEDALKDDSCPLAAHPSDYVLYRLGTFDEASGRLEAVVPPEHIIDISSLALPAAVGVPSLKVV